MKVASVTVQEPSDRDAIFAGARFVIVPVGHAESQQTLSPDRLVLPIDAAMAFGSGRHETTQLCLQALEQLIRPHHIVFDVGCGSGILALAAQKLGAAGIVAADIDESAIQVARRHFYGALFVGSADCFAAQSADIVICNITAKIDDQLAADLKRILKSSGSLIASGFTIQTPPKRFTPNVVLNQGEWQCWICSPQSIRADNQAGFSKTHVAQWWL
jgi:ribosomal protein L11 methyltransferase